MNNEMIALAAAAIQNMSPETIEVFMNASEEDQITMALANAQDSVNKQIKMCEILQNDDAKMAVMCEVVYDVLKEG